MQCHHVLLLIAPCPCSAQVGGAQGLLKLITELKLSVMTSNLEDLSRLVDEQNAAYEAEREATEDKVKRLRLDIAQSLKDLEAHYYSSTYRL